jgi:anti-anti-sigma regulatory factor
MTDMLMRAAEPADADTGVLEILLSAQDKRCLIRLRGPFVQQTLHAFSSVFDRLGRLSFGQVILDLKEVSELDEPGTKVLVGLHHYVAARRAELTVWCADQVMATSVSGLGMKAAVPLSPIR